MFDALVDGPAAPLEVLLAFSGTGFIVPEALRHIEQALCCVVAPIQNHVFNSIAQFVRKVFVNRQLAGVYDSHVHAGANSMKEKHRMNRFANDVVAAKRERDVADTSAD